MKDRMELKPLMYSGEIFMNFQYVVEDTQYRGEFSCKSRAKALHKEERKLREALKKSGCESICETCANRNGTEL